MTAKGADPDTLVASAKAYLGALNKLMVRRQRGAVAVSRRPRAFDRGRLIKLMRSANKRRALNRGAAFSLPNRCRF